MDADFRQELIYRIAERFRKLSTEFQDFSTECILVSPYKLGDEVLGHKHIYAPTICDITLGNCAWEMAREFENHPIEMPPLDPLAKIPEGQLPGTIIASLDLSTGEMLWDSNIKELLRKLSI